MSGDENTVHVEVELNDDTMKTVDCKLRFREFEKSLVLRKPDGTPFDHNDILRMGTDCEFINDLIAYAQKMEQSK